MRSVFDNPILGKPVTGCGWFKNIGQIAMHIWLFSWRLSNGRLSNALRSAAIIAAVAAPQAVEAAPVYTLSKAESGSVFGAANWSESVTITLNGHRLSTSAGLFRLRADDGGGSAFDFAAFCVEIVQSLRLPNSYEADTFTTQVEGYINALWANAFALVSGPSSAAAFQFALWDLTHDTDFNVSDGALRLQGRVETLALAQSWLNNIAGNIWSGDAGLKITRLVSGGSQDQLLVQRRGPTPGGTPVSAPGGGLLILSAALVYFCKRHRPWHWLARSMPA